MTHWPRHGRITGPIVMIGFGSIGKGTLPLIERHFEFDPDRFVVIDPNDSDRKLLDDRGVRFVHEGLTRENYRDVLTKYLTAGSGQGFCVNLSVDTSSLDLMRHCRELGALYVDTVVEPWPGFYYDKSLGNDARTNYALRETVLAERRKNPGGSTAVSCCGANPGMVSWFVKQALVNLAKDLGDKAPEPTSKDEWARLAQRLGVKGVHIAERDTQRAKSPKPRNVFVNTWSIEGFLSEGMQPAELGWGAHEKWAPDNAGYHKAGCGAAIYINQPGANTRVRSWTPTARAQFGFLVTHNESISIADYYTVRDDKGEPHTGRPATTPIIRATMRCSACTNCSAAPARSRARTIFLARPRSSTASTNWACFSTATPATPIGTARSSRSRRRARSRPTRTRPACRSRQQFWRVWSGRLNIRTPGSWKRTNWISGGALRFKCPISARSSASIRIGRRLPIALASSLRISTRAILGSSRTCWCDRRQRVGLTPRVRATTRNA